MRARRIALVATMSLVAPGMTSSSPRTMRELLVLPSSPPTASLPESRLAVFAGGRWQTWWNARSAPATWNAPLPIVANAVKWSPGATAGVEWGELRIAGNGEAWRLRVVLVRIDPERVSIQLDKSIRADSLGGAWTVDSAPKSSVVAFDAGQFSYGIPWGWVVRRGIEEQSPGSGPLSTGVMVDSSGAVTLTPASELADVAVRTRPVEAFQSYPTLLARGGEIPAPVRGLARDTASAIDVAHRDSRLALGTLRDGKLLVALTRFDGLGGVMAVVPFGPTVPEMAAIMGALGCNSAVMLDGGISGQLLLRDRDGTAHTWRGWRAVPIGVVVRARNKPR